MLSNSKKNYARVADVNQAKKRKKKQTQNSNDNRTRLICFGFVILLLLALIIALVVGGVSKSPTAATLENQYEHLTNTSAHFVVPSRPVDVVVPLKNVSAVSSSSTGSSSASARIVGSSTASIAPVSSTALAHAASSTGLSNNAASSTAAGSNTTASSDNNSSTSQPSISSSTASAYGNASSNSSVTSSNNSYGSSSSTGPASQHHTMTSGYAIDFAQLQQSSASNTSAFDVFVVLGYMDPAYHLPYRINATNQTNVFYLDEKNIGSTNAYHNNIYGSTQRALHALPGFASDWVHGHNSSNKVLFINAMTESRNATLSDIFDPTSTRFQQLIAAVQLVTSVNPSSTIQGILYDSDATLQIRNDNATVVALLQNLIAAVKYELPTASIDTNLVYTVLSQFDTMTTLSQLDSELFSTAYITSSDSRFDSDYFYQALTQLSPLEQYNKTISNTHFYAGFNSTGNYYCDNSAAQLIWTDSQDSVDDLVQPTNPIYGMFSALPFHASSNSQLLITCDTQYGGPGPSGSSSAWNTFYDSFAVGFNIAPINTTEHDAENDAGTIFYAGSMSGNFQDGGRAMIAFYNSSGVFVGHDNNGDSIYDESNNFPYPEFPLVLFPWNGDKYQHGISREGWTHLFINYDYDTDLLSVYRNGVTIGSRVFNRQSTFADYGINGLLIGGGNHYIPALDNKYVTNIRIHDYSVNAGQVKEIFYVDSYKQKYTSTAF